MSRRPLPLTWEEQVEAATDEGEPVDPFEDDTPLSCGIDNPDYCESCQ